MQKIALAGLSTQDRAEIDRDAALLASKVGITRLQALEVLSCIGMWLVQVGEGTGVAAVKTRIPDLTGRR